jgi:hypothetical protein
VGFGPRCACGCGGCAPLRHALEAQNRAEAYCVRQRPVMLAAKKRTDLRVNPLPGKEYRGGLSPASAQAPHRGRPALTGGPQPLALPAPGASSQERQQQRFPRQGQARQGQGYGQGQAYGAPSGAQQPQTFGSPAAAAAMFAAAARAQHHGGGGGGSGGGSRPTGVPAGVQLHPLPALGRATPQPWLASTAGGAA